MKEQVRSLLRSVPLRARIVDFGNGEAKAYSFSSDMVMGADGFEAMEANLRTSDIVMQSGIVVRRRPEWMKRVVFSDHGVSVAPL